MSACPAARVSTVDCSCLAKRKLESSMSSPSSMNEDGSGESAVPTQGGSVYLVLSAYYRHGSI